MRQLFWSAVVVAVLGACGPDSAAMLDDNDGEGVEFAEAELNVDLVLAWVNGPDATIEGLVQDVGLDRRVSTNIATRVRGADLARGTSDDRPLASLAELDAIPYVGPATITALDRFVTVRGGAGGTPVTVEGVSFTGAEATLAVAVVNDARMNLVGFQLSQRTSLEALRPHQSLVTIAAAASVGPAALLKLKSYVASLSPTPGPAPTPVACTEGKRDGVFFTAAEACKAVEFLNKARASEMYGMPKTAIDFAYRGGPSRPNGPNGRTAWAGLNEFTDAAGIGAAAATGLHAALVAGWQPNGLTSDTVADLWANRQALTDRPVRLDRVYVKRVKPREQDPSRPWIAFICAELRDTPTATNYLYACQTMVGVDSATGCSARDCITSKAGTWVNLRGELNTTGMPGAGGYRVNFSTEPTPAP